MKATLLATVLLLAFRIHGQMTVVVDAWPQLTPLLDTLYVAGSFNDWNPADPAYAMTYNGNTWSASIPGTNGSTVEYKVTRGSGWSTVEGSETGGYIPNRSLTYQDGGTEVISVAGWEDIAGNHTVTNHVRIFDSNFAMPQLDRTRRVWVALPENYFLNDMFYPVLYMHDGQNLFDAATSFAGEWQADETLQILTDNWCENFIIVGIDNGGIHRLDEYSPWVNSEYNEGGEGAQYADFVVNTLKPAIDQYFRTMPGREHTAVAGSSLGALISMYMIGEYPTVFSGAGLFSPAFWFNTEIFDHADAAYFPSDCRFYFAAGDSESAGMIPDMEAMITILEGSGLEANSILEVVVAGGEHNEAQWASTFPGGAEWIFDCITGIGTPSASNELMRIYPNPAAHDSIVITHDLTEIRRVEIRDASGRVVKSQEGPFTTGKLELDIRSLTRGPYTILIWHTISPGSGAMSFHVSTFVRQ